MASKYLLRFRDSLTLMALVLLVTIPGLSGLPVIDRDEARYAQASVQMIESGDYVNIRFQDRARNKKPAGAYWAQAASVQMVSNVKKREIWAHRIPSVLAALISVLALYWGGVRMLGRDVALMGSVLLAVSFLFVFEAHIAKTDALLCAFSVLALVAMGALRIDGGRKWGVLFWFALGCAVMVKGPLLPLLVLLSMAVLIIWERDIKWLKPFLFWPGPVLFALIVLPWGILIWKETGGAFFTDALGGDLAPKIKGGHERHGGPIGYYLLSIWVFFWPASLFLLPGFAFGMRAAFNQKLKSTPVAKSARLLLAYTIPFWLLLEIVPTKLPHYPLPIYPALALMAGASALTLTKVREFAFLRHINAGLFLIVSIALAAGVLFAQARFGNIASWSFVIVAVVIVLSFFAAIMVWKGKGRPAIWLSLLAALLIYIPTYQLILPGLKDLQIAGRISTALREHGYQTPLNTSVNLVSPHFTEPSLVYNLGTHILLGEPEKRIQDTHFKLGDLVIIDEKKEAEAPFLPRLNTRLNSDSLCLAPLFDLDGFNYVKGKDVEIEVFKVGVCKDAPTFP